MKKVKIAGCSAGWPDMMDPAIDVAKKSDAQYLAFDHLAELTMAILERQKAKRPDKGYIPDVIPLMREILPAWKKRRFKMITNAGGANPEQCAEEVIKLAKSLGITGLRIGVITGDDLPIKRVKELKAKGLKFKNYDNGEPDIDRVMDDLVAAYVYIGADRIIEALDQGADLVIGGRLSDNSLFVGPLMYEFGWKYKDAYWDRIGAAVCTAHLLECGTWSCGTCSNFWAEVPEPWHSGAPICEMDENGDSVISKVAGSGGLVRADTLKEHLVYEVHDPENYLMPDGIGVTTAIKLEDIGPNQVRISKLGDKPRGKPRPDTLKFCLAHADGYISEYTMIVPGPNAYDMAKRCEDFFYKRLEIVGVKPVETLVSFIGYNAIFGPTAPPINYEPNELGIRFAIKTKTIEEARQARLQATLSWYASGVGTAFGAPSEKEVFALWPSLIPREEVPTKLEMREVK